MPILLATSPFAAIRSAPTTTQEISPRAMSQPAMPSVSTVTGMPSRCSSQAVSRAPWKKGRVSSAKTCSSRPASRAARTMPSAVP